MAPPQTPAAGDSTDHFGHTLLPSVSSDGVPFQSDGESHAADAEWSLQHFEAVAHGTQACAHDDDDQVARPFF